MFSSIKLLLILNTPEEVPYKEEQTEEVVAEEETSEEMVTEVEEHTLEERNEE